MRLITLQIGLTIIVSGLDWVQILSSWILVNLVFQKLVLYYTFRLKAKCIIIINIDVRPCVMFHEESALLKTFSLLDLSTKFAFYLRDLLKEYAIYTVIFWRNSCLFCAIFQRNLCLYSTIFQRNSGFFPAILQWNLRFVSVIFW